MNTNWYGGTRSRHIRDWDQEVARQQAQQRAAKLSYEQEVREWTHPDELLGSPADPQADWEEAMMDSSEPDFPGDVRE